MKFTTLILFHNCLSPMNFCNRIFLYGGSSVVSIVTKLWAAWSRVQIPAGATVLTQNIRPVLKLIPPPIQWVSEAITPRHWQRDWLQHDVEHSVCLAVRVRINGAIPLFPPA